MESIYFLLLLVILATLHFRLLKATSAFRQCYWCSHTEENVRLVHPEFPPDESCEDPNELQCKLSPKQCSNPSDMCITFTTLKDSTTFNVTGRGCVTMAKDFPKGCTNTTADVLRNFSSHSLIWQLEGKVEICVCDTDGCNGNMSTVGTKSKDFNEYPCDGKNSAGNHNPFVWLTGLVQWFYFSVLQYIL